MYMCGGTSSSAGLTVSVVKDPVSGESVVRPKPIALRVWAEDALHLDAAHMYRHCTENLGPASMGLQLTHAACMTTSRPGFGQGCIMWGFCLFVSQLHLSAEAEQCCR